MVWAQLDGGHWQGLAFVVDATDPEWLPHARALLAQELLGRGDMTGLPLLVLASKQDRPGALHVGAVAAGLGLDGACVRAP